MGHSLAEAGRSVLIAPAYRLVQVFLVAKPNLDLHRPLRKLDNSEFLKEAPLRSVVQGGPLLYTVNLNLIKKVLDFVQFGGPSGTVIQTFEWVVSI